MLYLYLKSLHIIFIVSWFAGLFYLVRLFVYYAEAQQLPNPERDILSKQYRIMTMRLWQIITQPAAIIATAFGIWMLIENPSLLQMPWMHIKLLFVVALWIYHLVCRNYVLKMQNGQLTKTNQYFRIFNEGATLILFAVVFLVILKNSVDWIYGVVGLFALAIILMIGIKWYKKYRKKK